MGVGDSFMWILRFPLGRYLYRCHGHTPDALLDACGLGHFLYYVLLVLHQPMHGYEIMNEITRITNGEITVGAGSLYTLLPKFEKECYIKLVKVENNKKIYQITNLGKKKLQKEKERMLKQISLLDQIGG